jgi:hypothetical protein
MPTSTVPEAFAANAPLVLASKQVCGPDRSPVCFAFRVQPDNEADSGWVFWSGHEDQAFIDDNSNTIVCPLFSFIDMDPTLLDVLRNPVGTAWERDHVGGEWREVKDYFSPRG